MEPLKVCFTAILSISVLSLQSLPALAQDWKWATYRSVRMAVPAECKMTTVRADTKGCTIPQADACDRSLGLVVVEQPASGDLASAFRKDNEGAWKIFQMSAHAAMLNQTSGWRIQKEKTRFRRALAVSSGADSCFEVDMQLRGTAAAVKGAKLYIHSLHCGFFANGKLKTARAEVNELNCKGARVSRDFKTISAQIFNTLQLR